MANQRRKCRLADVESRNVNLRKDAPIIIATINTTVAGKHPKESCALKFFMCICTKALWSIHCKTGSLLFLPSTSTHSRRRADGKNADGGGENTA